MDKIFISYRRADMSGLAGRVYDRLVQRFGKNAVFMDVDSIPPGVDFHPFIVESVAQSALMLILIGPRWFDLLDGNGRRRLDDPSDVVRFEIETALAHTLTVIPVYLSRETPPVPRVPPSLMPAFQQPWAHVDAGPSFDFDLETLTLRVERLLAVDHVQQVRSIITIAQVNAWLLYTWQLVIAGFAIIIYLFTETQVLIHESGSPSSFALASRLMIIAVAALALMISLFIGWLRILSILGLTACWGILGAVAGQWLTSLAITAHQDSQLAVSIPAALGAFLLLFGAAFNVSLYARYRGHGYSDYRGRRGSLRVLLR